MEAEKSLPAKEAAKEVKESLPVKAKPTFPPFPPKSLDKIQARMIFCHRFLYAFLTAGSQAHCGSDEAFGRLGENES